MIGSVTPVRGRCENAGMVPRPGDSVDWSEVDRLTAALPRRSLIDRTALAAAGRTLGVVWPADYEHVISGHDGVEGDVGDWRLVLWPVEELVDHNTGDHMQSFAGLVLLGGDGAGEALALDRSSGEVLLASGRGRTGLACAGIIARRGADPDGARHRVRCAAPRT